MEISRYSSSNNCRYSRIYSHYDFHNFGYVKGTLRDRILNRNSDEKRDQIYREIKQDYAANGQFKMRTVEHVNILIIGRTRTGKSTIKSLLVDPTTIPDELTLKSGDKDPQFQAFYLQDRDVVLNMIDSPGLFERSSNKIDIRDNQAILQTIKMCANMEITKFHAICFCVSLTSGINKEDIDAIEALMKYFGNETSRNACLIITHCESIDKTQREDLRQQLVTDTAFKNIASFFKLGILFSGSINRDDYNRGNESVYEQFFTITDYRIQLIEMFLSVTDPLPISDTKISLIQYPNDLRTYKETQMKNSQRSLIDKEDIIAPIQEKAVEDEQHMKQSYKYYENTPLYERSSQFATEPSYRLDLPPYYRSRK